MYLSLYTGYISELMKETVILFKLGHSVPPSTEVISQPESQN